MKCLFSILFICALFTGSAQDQASVIYKLADSNAVKARIDSAFKNDKDIEKTIGNIRTALSMAERINYQVSDSVTRELIRYGDYYIENSGFEIGRQFYTMALKQAYKQKYLDGIKDGLFLAGEYYHEKGILDSSLYFLRCAKAYCIKTNDKKLLQKTNLGIENCYYVAGNGATGLFWSKIHGRRLAFLDLDSILFFGVYLGALLFCFIYNLYLYRFTRDKAYRELAKCILTYMIYVYTTNNDFASQFLTNMFQQTVLEFFKCNSLFFGTYFFAGFLQFFLIDKKETLQKFFNFLKIYRKLIVSAIIVSNLLVLASGLKNSSNYTALYQTYIAWFGLNAIVGMICTIVLFTRLFSTIYKYKLQLHYLVYGLFANLLLLILAFIQSAMKDKFSHIPYPHALGAALFLIFMTVAIADKINLYRKQKEDAQQNALENLEKIVVERTFDLQQQKHMVEEKNKEITDSITYAKRLQNAILPPLNFISKHLPQSFVLYKPKDIVAGDFYWCETVRSAEPALQSSASASGRVQGKSINVSAGNLKNPGDELVLIAAADCTGHGVPGAMVSVVCSNALNRSVKEFGITEPGKILDKTRELVLETFARSESEVKDGMDISLLCIDSKNKKVSWSGANNSLWYIHNGVLEEIKADKQPIGKTDYAKPFTTHEINYREATTFYLFTDGLSDQFGGEKGKKLKHKQVKDVLLANEKLPLNQQAEKLIQRFDNWKGTLEQVDDVCMIGIRV